MCVLTPHGALVFLLLFIITVDDHSAQVWLQHGAAVFDHGLCSVTHGAGGPHGPCTFCTRLHHSVRVHLSLFLLDDTRQLDTQPSHTQWWFPTVTLSGTVSCYTYRVVIFLLQLSLLLLLPFGFHLHGFSYQFSQNWDWLGLVDELVLDVERKKKKRIVVCSMFYFWVITNTHTYTSFSCVLWTCFYGIKSLSLSTQSSHMFISLCVRMSSSNL